jgi:actin-related protein 5
MLQNLCEFSTDYLSLLRSFKEPPNLLAAERIIQFPFAQSAMEEKTEEELVKIAEKRKEQGRKLQEMAAKSRQEKVRCSVPLSFPSRTHNLQLAKKEDDLQHLTSLREGKSSNKKGWTVSSITKFPCKLSMLLSRTRCKQKGLMTMKH